MDMEKLFEAVIRLEERQKNFGDSMGEVKAMIRSVQDNCRAREGCEGGSALSAKQLAGISAVVSAIIAGIAAGVSKLFGG